MCTVSMVRAGDHLRVMCNRDERHDRPLALSPRVVRTGPTIAMYPVDPQGGGTWIAASDAGLVVTVLNAQGPPGAPGLSRGQLVVALAGCRSLEDVVDRARRLCGRDWPPHRLVATDGDRVIEVRLQSSGVTCESYGSREPLMFTSSSLGAEVVEAPRRALFDELVGNAADRFDGQDAFHRHRWLDRPDVSVHMRRHDAATQSITTVDVRAARTSIRYEPTDLVGTPAVLSVERRRRTRPSVEVERGGAEGDGAGLAKVS